MEECDDEVDAEVCEDENEQVDQVSLVELNSIEAIVDDEQEEDAAVLERREGEVVRGFLAGERAVDRAPEHRRDNELRGIGHLEDDVRELPVLLCEFLVFHDAQREAEVDHGQVDAPFREVLEVRENRFFRFQLRHRPRDQRDREADLSDEVECLALEIE